jgi:hypothetical protein
MVKSTSDASAVPADAPSDLLSFLAELQAGKTKSAPQSNAREHVLFIVSF